MAVSKRVLIAGELTELRQAADRTRTQLLDSQQREKVLVRRLTAKEQEMQDYVVSIVIINVVILKCLHRDWCRIGLYSVKFTKFLALLSSLVIECSGFLHDFDLLAR